MVGEKRAECFQLVVGQHAALRHVFQAGGDHPPGADVEKPESGHGGVINDRIIPPHFEPERVDLPPQIEQIVAIGHAVVAENIEPHVPVMRMSDFHEMCEALFVGAEFSGDFGRLVADAVQQAVQVRPVEEGEIDALPGDIVQQVF